MNELIHELRNHEKEYPSLVHASLCGLAADEIERLKPYVDAFRREEARADKLATRVDDLESKLAEAKLALEAPTKEEITLRAQLAEANQIIHDLTDGITGTLQKDDIESLRLTVDGLQEEITRGARQLAEARKALEAIKQATIDGRVCDDVAWFDTITTLHDYCENVLVSFAGETGKK